MLYNIAGVLYNIKCYVTPCFITGGVLYNMTQPSRCASDTALLVWAMLSPKLLRCTHLLRRRFLPPLHLPVHTLLGIALARQILFPLFLSCLPFLSLVLFLLPTLFLSLLLPLLPIPLSPNPPLLCSTSPSLSVSESRFFS
jgi:hypothetical protein